jgi:hypothetical protein
LDNWNSHFAIAMLRRAIVDWRAGVGRPEWSKRGRLSAEARDWIFNSERRAHVRFEDVCEVLGAEPNWMRAMLRAEYATAE